MICNKLKNKIYHTVDTIPKSNIKIIERDKSIPLTIKCVKNVNFYGKMDKNYKTLQRQKHPDRETSVIQNNLGNINFQQKNENICYSRIILLYNNIQIWYNR